VMLWIMLWRALAYSRALRRRTVIIIRETKVWAAGLNAERGSVMTNDGKKTPEPSAEDWRTLAQEASAEPDPNKLMEIVEHLCEAIDRAKSDPSKPPSPSKPDQAA